MLNFFKIAANTFKESVREPIYALLLMCAVLLIANFPFVAIFVFYDQVKLVVDSSMATTMLFGLFAAVLCSSNTVSREMRDGTVLLLFSKPVFRSTFILAKIAGIHTYSSPGNAVYVGNGVAAIHRLSTAEAVVDFGKKVLLLDPLSGKELGKMRYWKPQISPGECAAVCYLPLENRK